MALFAPTKAQISGDSGFESRAGFLCPVGPMVRRLTTELLLPLARAEHCLTTFLRRSLAMLTIICAANKSKASDSNWEKCICNILLDNILSFVSILTITQL